MAHELEIRNGDASMFYVGEAPWHGLGTKLDKPATAAEAIKAAKLDWRVRKVPLYAIDGDVRRRVRNTFGVVRDDLWGQDDCPVLGIVGQEYTPLQNEEAFAFFDPIVGRNAAIYHTAGVLRDGQRIWILAKLPHDIVIKGDDVAERYLLLSNSHDGESSVQVKFTPIRVVCQNTLTMALSEGRTIRVAHNRDVTKELQNARRIMGMIDQRYEEIGETFRQMCRVYMDHDRLSEYLSEVFPDPSKTEERAAFKRVWQNRSLAEWFFDGGQGNTAPGIRGTLWAAYNGVTELIDHRQTKQTDDRRLDSLWFGSGYVIKARAFNVAQRKVRAWMN